LEAPGAEGATRNTRGAPSVILYWRGGAAPRIVNEMSTALRRTITFKDLVLLVVGVVIGSGIFITPATVLTQVHGDVGIALLVWLAGGLLSLLGALTYGELGAMRPESGGLYVFMRDAFGPFVAFLFGWTLFFAIGAGAVATLATAFVGYVSTFLSVSNGVGKGIALGMVALLAALNIRGTRQSTSVNTWATAIKFLALIAMSVALLATGPGLGSFGASVLPRELAIGMLPAIGTAMIGVLWAYEGWQWVTFSAGEIIDANRTFPRAMLLGTLALVALYALANLAYIAAIGPDEAMKSESIAATAMTARFGSVAGRLVALPILISIFSAANGVVLTGSRVFYAMAKDGLFFRKLAEVHPRLGTPAFSIAAFCGWGALLAVTGTFQQLLTYVVFTGWMFYALGAASIFVLRRTEPDAPRPYRVPGYPLTPILFVLAAVAIVANTLFTQPVQGLIGIGVVFVGAPAYFVWRRRATGTAPVHD
jgi:APA family basic amino acid/polyamine antiporter